MMGLFSQWPFSGWARTQVVKDCLFGMHLCSCLLWPLPMHCDAPHKGLKGPMPCLLMPQCVGARAKLIYTHSYANIRVQLDTVIPLNWPAFSAACMHSFCPALSSTAPPPSCRLLPTAGHPSRQIAVLLRSGSKQST